MMRFRANLSFVAFAAILAVFSTALRAQELQAMKAEQLFVIPWGDDWGSLDSPLVETSEGTKDGPPLMHKMRALPDSVLVADRRPPMQRFYRFSLQGKLLQGIEAETPSAAFTHVAELLQPNRPPSIYLASYGAGSIFQVDLPAIDSDGAAKVELQTVVPGTALVNADIQGIAPTGYAPVFVEAKAPGSRLPEVRHYDGSSLRRKINAVDLRAGAIYHYALATNRTSDALEVTGDGALLLLQIDPEGNVRETPVPVPQDAAPQGRWHLVGVEGGTTPTRVLLAHKGHLVAGMPIWMVTPASGMIRQVQLPAIPGEVERSEFLRHKQHLHSVTPDGIIYRGIPTEEGFAIIRYSLE